jgi:hypothetical protein
VGKYGILTKKRAFTGTKLIWNKLEAVIIFHEEDITHSFFEDFVFIIDKQLTIPKAVMYHSTILEKNNLFNKFIDIENFNITYLSDNEFNLVCEVFKINYYEAYMARPIAHLILYLTFFFDWFEHYIKYKFILDDETQLEKYEIMKDKIVHRTFLINSFKFDINDNPVTSASIFQANKSELEKNMTSIINYLRRIKTDLLTLEFKEIFVEINNSFEVTKNPHKKGEYNFYNRILVDKILTVKIPITELQLESNVVFTMGNLFYSYITKIDYYNYKNNEILTQLLLYDRHTIIRKKIAFDSKIEKEFIVKQDDIKFNFQDVIVFDKTLSFLIKAFKTISKIPIKNCQTNMLMDRIPNSDSKIFFATIFGINGDINSLDPKTKEKYNTLKIKIKEISYLSDTKMEGVEKLKDNVELSLNYLLLGFIPSEKSGFPLFSLPLCELNIDNIKDITKINFPTNIPLDETLYTEIFTEKNNQELNRLVNETKSLTIFLNYQHLATFYKIFKIFLDKTSQIRKTHNTNNQKEKEKENDINSNNKRRTLKLNTLSSKIRN